VEKRIRGRNATGERVVSLDFFYFNLRRGKLEYTKYLRTLLRTFRDEEAEKYVVPGFAEPLDPLRPEKEILARYEAAERRLDKRFGAVLQLKTSEEEKRQLRDYQRLWLKARDAGAEAFAATESKAEEARHKLQYLADATESRVSELERYLK
jgi:lysozyme inhibitor LprI